MLEAESVILKNHRRLSSALDFLLESDEVFDVHYVIFFVAFTTLEDVTNQLHGWFILKHNVSSFIGFFGFVENDQALAHGMKQLTIFMISE